MIEELCKKIKDKRAKLDLSIEEVVEKTKLHPVVIHDIEDGNLTGINATYLKGFVRIYASFLGVPLEEGVLNEIAIAVAKEREEMAISAKKPAPPYNIKNTVILGFILVAIVWGFVAVGGFIIRRMAQKKFKKVSPAVVEPVKAEPKKVKVEKVVPQVQVKKELKELAVSLTAKRNCFVRVKVDGKLLFEGILKKGIVESWKAERELEFKISDGSAIQIELNGEILPAQKMRKPIKSLKITPSGVSVIK